ncbi:cytochrome oxidase putative small subunit CydP [Paludibacterium yongneupense]|uniref:cytochrome oxidase putative small subunit CydP n=1 Tax=Paludibacterium yongneupense TaxID=400061 RepID=UPI00040FA00F|nr:cytochrome oxidase putative small subunit CydP [Paludibacterium yongneupense]
MKRFLARSGRPLWLDVTVVLLFKAALLWGAWYLWFSHPLAPHMRAPVAAVEDHLLGQPVPAAKPEASR